MKKILLPITKLITAFGVTLHFAYSMDDACLKNEFDSLSISGKFSASDEIAIFNSVKMNVKKAEKEASKHKGWRYTHNDPKNYHLSVVIVEPIFTGEKLGQIHLDTLKKNGRKLFGK